jgi:hypothetical protein
MAKFGTASVTEVLPASRKNKGTGERAAIAAEYRKMLNQAINDGVALVVDLDEGEKALTARNRLLAAATKLGMAAQIVIKKVHNKPQVIAYHVDHDLSDALPDGALPVDGDDEEEGDGSE